MNDFQTDNFHYKGNSNFDKVILFFSKMLCVRQRPVPSITHKLLRVALHTLDKQFDCGVYFSH